MIQDFWSCRPVRRSRTGVYRGRAGAAGPLRGGGQEADVASGEGWRIGSEGAVFAGLYAQRQ
jgi:hypothetical protein